MNRQICIFVFNSYISDYSFYLKLCQNIARPCFIIFIIITGKGFSTFFQNFIEISFIQRFFIQIKFKTFEQIFFWNFAVFKLGEKIAKGRVNGRAVHHVLVFSFRQAKQIGVEIIPRTFQIIVESSHR